MLLDHTLHLIPEFSNTISPKPIAGLQKELQQERTSKAISTLEKLVNVGQTEVKKKFQMISTNSRESNKETNTLLKIDVP